MVHLTALTQKLERDISNWKDQGKCDDAVELIAVDKVLDFPWPCDATERHTVFGSLMQVCSGVLTQLLPITRLKPGAVLAPLLCFECPKPVCTTHHSLPTTHHSLLTTYNLLLSPHPPHYLPLTPHSALLTPHPSLLTPHSLLLTPHPSRIAPHVSPLTYHP